MTKELKQKKYFINREIRISENRVYYKVTKYNNCDEKDIQFENISGEKVTYKYSNNYALVMSIMFLVCAVFFAINSIYDPKIDKYAPYYILVFSLSFFLGYLFTRAEYWKIKLNDNGFIQIHKNIPDKESTDKFYSSLILARNEYLKDNYGIIDEHIDYQIQLGELKWLKSINAISKTEYQDKLILLKKTVKPTNNGIGFSK